MTPQGHRAFMALLVFRVFFNPFFRVLVFFNPFIRVLGFFSTLLLHRRAIGRNGLKFVTLLRLSPLLPLAASNCAHLLHSVQCTPCLHSPHLHAMPPVFVAYVSRRQWVRWYLCPSLLQTYTA